MTVFVFVSPELEGQRASFLPNMMNGFFINHNDSDDGPEAFSGCSRLRGAPGSGLAPFWGRFWPFLIPVSLCLFFILAVPEAVLEV